MSAAAAATAAASTTPVVVDENDITRISFGSCNKQWEPQPLWDSIASLDPQVWLWLGDAVYVKKPGTVEQLETAYKRQLANEDYQRFLSSGVIVEGVYDDHDYGVNDAGGELTHKPQRQELFLNFLGNVAADDPRRTKGALYYSRTFGTGPKQIKAIFLDTRSHRGAVYGMQVDGWMRWLPFVAYIQAGWRMGRSVLCLGGEHDGDMLGEDQWTFLERELVDSPAAAHVIVSTVQVLTSVPVQESWGHFPKSKMRLLKLLDQTHPRGLVLLSGDVHFGEIHHGLSAKRKKCARGAHYHGQSSHSHHHAPEAEENGVSGSLPLPPPPPLPVVELTTSGLTHCCGRLYPANMCEVVLNAWGEHRSIPPPQQPLVIGRGGSGGGGGGGGGGLGFFDEGAVRKSREQTQQHEVNEVEEGKAETERRRQETTEAEEIRNKRSSDEETVRVSVGPGGADGRDAAGGYYVLENFGMLEVDWMQEEKGEDEAGGCQLCEDDDDGGGGGGAKRAAAPICRGDLHVSLRDATGLPLLSFTRSTCDRMADHLSLLADEECVADVIPRGCAPTRVLGIGSAVLVGLSVTVLVGKAMSRKK